MNEYSMITPDIRKLAAMCMERGHIPAGLYDQYHVLRGLRDVNGKGVLAGLTDISTVLSSKIVDGKSIPIDGELYYRGYNISDLVKGFASEERLGFEEIAFLLIFGELPDEDQLKGFKDLLGKYRTLPTNFVRDVIMKAPGRDMMNTLQRGVLTLYGYDDMADDTHIDNVLRQCLQLISTVPLLAVYGYQSYNHYIRGKSLYIHSPKPELSTAENILRMLRPDKAYTTLEARILDIALVLHMDHGGGNNSTFTNHVVTSSGTDTYSAMAASLGSLKGPKHGGANLKVVRMFDELKMEIKDWTDDEEITAYLNRLLNKDAFDHSGLIYGMGHAVYSISDPRAQIFKCYVGRLAGAKGYEKEYDFYCSVERLATELIQKKRRIY
ncbi:MAG: citrate synthase, partial [Eubacterium sp.]|nr:citrate synthase [Eubacterium sp.]